MISAYDYKVIKSGRILEEYIYTIPIDYDCIIRKKNKKIKKNKFRKDNIHRTQTNLRRIIQCNPDLKKFITLTFKENITDLKSAHKIFDRYIKRLRYKYGQFKYIAIPEYTKKGRVHYHMLATLPYIRNRTLRNTWQQGFVNIKEIGNQTSKIAIYLSKYLNKQNQELFYRKKKYYTSQNIKKPIIYKDNIAVNIMYNLLDKELQFEKTYTNEFRGRIIYKIYKVNKKKCHYLQKEKSEIRKNTILKSKEKKQLHLPL